MNCPKCGLMNTGNMAVGLAMPQCMCHWQAPAAQRQWVGLTDEEIETLYYAVDGNEFPLDFYKEIEAKLKEKNYQKGETDK